MSTHRPPMQPSHNDKTTSLAGTGFQAPMKIATCKLIRRFV
jgi:hypothetical protein